MLVKIDKLFACGVGEMIDLPQIVVVGDQSSGKSSVLEGLIKKPLPRNSGLCTRFATQIIFRSAAVEQIRVSIIPDRDATPEHARKVRKWGREVVSLDGKAFTRIMEEVHEEMGLSGCEDETKKPTFSNDVLSLEISGPDQEHLSVIDVPGIFKSTTEGVTTKYDIQLVRDMVKGYMDNPRSVMLAVIPSNVDVATQEILELATEADVDGTRTLGVLTKPDLVDKGAEAQVIDLLNGRIRPMKLGWHVIRKPGQKDLSDPDLNRGALEMAFFRSVAPWNSIEKERVGVDSLRLRLKEVLSSLVKKEFPKVKAEIKGRLDTHCKRMKDLGPERKDSVEQMAYLTELATKFQRLVTLALTATYGADDVFSTTSALHIAPAVVARSKIFSTEMAKHGHTYTFLPNDGSEPTAPTPVFGAISASGVGDIFNVRREEDVDALVDILHDQEKLPQQEKGKITAWLLQVFQENRGFELGTFNSSILATTMKKQSVKWPSISMGFVSDIIVMVHRFITSALSSVCPDREVRHALISTLSDDLLRRYQLAIDNVSFLLEVESTDPPTTQNHYFNDNLQKRRHDKAMVGLKKNAFQANGLDVIRIDQVSPSQHMSNEQYVVQDIHDILQAYYKVTRKTFVDTVCKQAVSHYLLHSKESPLALFSPILVSRLSPAELEEISGEVPALKRERAQLAKEVASLGEAMKILARA